MNYLKLFSGLQKTSRNRAESSLVPKKMLRKVNYDSDESITTTIIHDQEVEVSHSNLQKTFFYLNKYF